MRDKYLPILTRGTQRTVPARKMESIETQPKLSVIKIVSNVQNGVKLPVASVTNMHMQDDIIVMQEDCTRSEMTLEYRQDACSISA